MKVKKRDSGKTERRILTGMILDTAVVSKMSEVWKRPGPFRSAWANVLGSLCVNFFRERGCAPRQSIELLFDDWADQNTDNRTADLLNDFLASIGDEYGLLDEQPAAETIIQLAARYFEEVSLEQLRDGIDNLLETNRIEEAAAFVRNFTRVEFESDSWIDPFSDHDAIIDALTYSADQNLIKYPGALGQFFEGQLERDAFVAFMGPDKRGKSFWLLDMAYRAALQRNRVAYFVIGDMSRSQVMRRLMARASKRPFKAGKIKIPTRFFTDDGIMGVHLKEKEFTEPLLPKEAVQACNQVIKHKIKSRQPYLRLSVHASDTLSVAGLRNTLVRWDQTAEEGWIPDVVVVDYADNLAAVDSRHEVRDQINKTWSNLRGIAQELNCLVVTATQSDAAAYTAKLLRRNNFSDSKRKNAHVTGMIGINVSGIEKAMGMTRLNWIQARDSEFSEDVCVFCAGSLGVANPAIRSSFWFAEEDSRSPDS